MTVKEVVLKAIEQLQLFAEPFLAQSWATWGPKYVHGYVRMPGLDEDVSFTLGDRMAAVEGEQFWDYARHKLEAASRENTDTCELVALAPWLLKPGENYYSGGVARKGIKIGVSGVHGVYDHMLAAMLAETISAMIIAARDEHIAAHEMIIP